LRVVPREKDDWMKFLDSLAAVHNSGAIDLVAEFGELRKDGPDFFLRSNLPGAAQPGLTWRGTLAKEAMLKKATSSGSRPYEQWCDLKPD